jgi:hypothetical protein
MLDRELVEENLDAREQAQCKGKEAYLTWEMAEKVCRRRRRAKKVPVQPYRCRFCSHFHIGHNPRRMR